MELLELAPDAALLRTALDAVAARHEVLRTRFQRQRDGTVSGVVVPAAEFHVPVVVVTAASEEELVREVLPRLHTPLIWRQTLLFVPAY